MKPASVIAVLVLLGAVTLGAWVVSPDGPPTAAPATETPGGDPTPRLPYVEPPPDPLVVPPDALVFERTGAPGKFAGSGVLTDEEVELAEENGVVRITGRITRGDAGVTLGVWRLATDSDPRPALAALDGLYERGGHELEPTDHPGLLLRRRGNAFHGHYAHGTDVFRVEAYGSGAAPALAELVDRQLALTPAEGS
ncbi:hypothetical protein ACIGNX_15930 [Actinosynnema sp. NPDC053489]|uniref:hypothetical protein n=1 Tax=Actinosynnema sp. NPDC053489 TaxID=3363916 RepID=UPI0037CA361B